MTRTEDIEWWNTPGPWKCDSCGASFDSLDHIDLAVLDGYDETQSSKLCTTCWPILVRLAERDRLIAESTAEIDLDRVTYRHPSGWTATEPVHHHETEQAVAELGDDLDAMDEKGFRNGGNETTR